MIAQLLAAAQDASGSVNGLPDWLKLGAGGGGAASMTILAWALYTRRLVSREVYLEVVAERDAARLDVKTLTDGMMQEVIPLVTRQGDLLKAIEPRIQPTLRLTEPGA